jgi:hypothetical protein
VRLRPRERLRDCAPARLCSDDLDAEQLTVERDAHTPGTEPPQYILLFGGAGQAE